MDVLLKALLSRSFLTTLALFADWCMVRRRLVDDGTGVEGSTKERKLLVFFKFLLFWYNSATMATLFAEWFMAGRRLADDGAGVTQST